MTNYSDDDKFDDEYFRRELFNAEAFATLRRAQAEALSLGQSEINAELLLIGLMENSPSVAVAIVRALGQLPSQIQQATRSLQVTGPTSIAPSVSMPVQVLLGQEAKQICRVAVDEAIRMPSNPPYTGSEHLLLGLTRSDSKA